MPQDKKVYHSVGGRKRVLTRLPETIHKATKWYKALDPIDKAAVATAPIPIVGDVVGTTADIKAFKEEPSWGNAGWLGAGIVIPFIGGSTLRNMFKGDKKTEVLKLGEQGVTDINTVAKEKELIAQVETGILHPTEANEIAGRTIIDVEKYIKDGQEALKKFEVDTYGSPVSSEDYTKFIKVVDDLEEARGGVELPKEMQDRIFQNIVNSNGGSEVTDISKATRSPKEGNIVPSEVTDIQKFRYDRINDFFKGEADKSRAEGSVSNSAGTGKAVDSMEEGGPNDFLSPEGLERLANAIRNEDLPKAEVIDIKKFDDRRPMQEVVLHATDKDFPEFKLTGVDKLDDGWFGGGIYFTPNPEVANRFADIRRKNRPFSLQQSEEIEALIQNSKAKTAHELQEEVKNLSRKFREQNQPTVNIRPTRINLKKPLVVNQKGATNSMAIARLGMFQAIGRDLKRNPKDIQKEIASFGKSLPKEMTGAEVITKYLQSLGYDGVLVRDRGGLEIPVFGVDYIEEIVVFDPKQTRSVFQNAEVIDFPIGDK